MADNKQKEEKPPVDKPIDRAERKSWLRKAKVVALAIPVLIGSVLLVKRSKS